LTLTCESFCLREFELRRGHKLSRNDHRIQIRFSIGRPLLQGSQLRLVRHKRMVIDCSLMKRTSPNLTIKVMKLQNCWLLANKRMYIKMVIAELRYHCSGFPRCFAGASTCLFRSVVPLPLDDFGLQPPGDQYGQ
jgi:hypothetical protein